MAEILHLLLEGQLLVQSVENWLTKGECGDCLPLVEYDNRKSEFVSIFLSFLRTENSWILQKTAKTTHVLSSNSETQSTNESFDVAIRNNEKGTTFAQSPDKDESIAKGTLYRSPKIVESKGSSKINLRSESYIKGKQGKKHKFNPKNNTKNKIVPDINDLDDFPPVGSAHFRRITPTPASAKCVAFNPNASVDSLKILPSKSIFSTSPLIENNDVGLRKERQLLKEARRQHRNEIATMDITNTEVVNKIPRSNITCSKSDQPYIVPRLEDVTGVKKINMLVDLYVTCTTSNFMPSLGSELYFIIQLLTVQTKKENKTVKVFTSVHNCVYFAISVLEKATQMLLLLDQYALKVMAGLPYLHLFSEVLVSKIKELENVACVNPVVHVPSVHGVAYEEETDNRKNFPTDNAFRIFCRQRDSFYELWRDWCSQHSTSAKFTRQVQQIVGQSVGPTNFAHLARLLIMQMIGTCSKNVDVSSNTESSTPEELRQNSVEKLDKLKQRMMTPSHVGNPCLTASNLNNFFHEFVLAADSASLNQHLIDQLKSKITNLNNKEVSLPDSESKVMEQNAYAAEVKHNFWSLLAILRHLAKFLGFVIFLPYHDRANNTWCISVEPRSLSLPLDLLQLLEEAENKGHLVLTVPWIVEYLSVMDCGAPNLEYYSKLFCKLILIYRHLTCMPNIYTRLFLQLMMGNLFETRAFPQSVFFLTSIHSLSKDKVKAVTNCDNLDLIERMHVLKCFPYMSEIRALLKGIHTGGKEIRKITPISVGSEDITCTSTEKNLQQDLEDNFFHLHPTSTKRTVEFVADCVSSNVIKKIKQCVIPHILEDVSPKSNDEANGQEIHPKTHEIYHQIKEKGLTFAKEHCTDKIPQAMHLLLPDETTNDVIQMCTVIALRMVVDRVAVWLNSLLNSEYITQELCLKIKQKGNKNSEENDDSSIEVDILVPNLASITQSLRHLYLGENISEDSLRDILAKLGHFTRSNSKMFRSVIQNIKIISLDLAVAVTVFQPFLMNEEILEMFVRLWYEDLADPKIGSSLLCPRNFQLLKLSLNQDDSWDKFRTLVFEICCHTDVTTIVTNSKNVLEQQWSKDSLTRFRNLLKDLFERFESLAEDKELRAWVISSDP